MSSREKNLALYERAVSLCPEIERKGKSMPYTSANGHMFSQLNKAGQLGIRFSKERQQHYLKELDTTLFKSYGAIMRGYILVPAKILNDPEQVAKYLQESHEYVMSLEPK